MASSTGSVASFIAPSLVSQVYDGSIDESHVEYGVAQVVHLGSVSSSAALDQAKVGDENADSISQQFADYSISDYGTSPPSPSESDSKLLISPNNYLPTTGSSFEFDLNKFSSPQQQSQTLPTLVRYNSSPALSHSGSFRNFSRPNLLPNSSSDLSVSRALRTVQASETEEMSPTPSPSRRYSVQSGAEPPSLPGLWSPRLIPSRKNSPGPASREDSAGCLGDRKVKAAQSVGARRRSSDLPRRMPAAWGIFDTDPDMSVEGAAMGPLGGTHPLKEGHADSQPRLEEEQNEEAASGSGFRPREEQDRKSGNWI